MIPLSFLLKKSGYTPFALVIFVLIVPLRASRLESLRCLKRVKRMQWLFAHKERLGHLSTEVDH